MATLWIGGTSSLAETFFDEFRPFDGAFVLAGPEPPCQPSLASRPFVTLDLASERSVRSLFERLPLAVEAVIFGPRLSLVWGSDAHLTLISHLALLLERAAAAGVRAVLHLSSVAVSDHTLPQAGVRESDPMPPLEAIASGYDRFKRAAEEVITAECASRSLRCVHLRLSGIFSNTRRCIQCTTLRRQRYVGSYVPVRIDFNTGRNVGVAITLLLGALLEPADAARPLAPAYYYTRDAAPCPPYGAYVAAYRAASGVRAGLWVPPGLAALFVALIHLARRLVGGAWLTSLDYLMRVSEVEHTFDNGLFRRRFPEIAAAEEAVVPDGLARIARRHH